MIVSKYCSKYVCGSGAGTIYTPDGADLKSSQVIYISQLTQTVTFGFTKLAVVLFYRRYRISAILQKTIL